jgi:hypothetical protein
VANKGVSGSIMAAIGRRDNIRHKVEQLKNFFEGGGHQVDRFLFEKKEEKGISFWCVSDISSLQVSINTSPVLLFT